MTYEEAIMISKEYEERADGYPPNSLIRSIFYGNAETFKAVAEKLKNATPIVSPDMEGRITVGDIAPFLKPISSDCRIIFSLNGTEVFLCGVSDYPDKTVFFELKEKTQ